MASIFFSEVLVMFQMQILFQPESAIAPNLIHSITGSTCFTHESQRYEPLSRINLNHVDI